MEEAGFEPADKDYPEMALFDSDSQLIEAFRGAMVTTTMAHRAVSRILALMVKNWSRCCETALRLPLGAHLHSLMARSVVHERMRVPR